MASKLLLKRHFQLVVTCSQPNKIPELMSANEFDAVLLDMNFSPGESSGEQGFYWLKNILAIDPDAVVVMITAHGGVNVAVEAMKHGATDFIAKPWQNEKVVATLSAATELRASRTEAKQLKQRNKALREASGSQTQTMLGNSEAMRRIHSIIQRTAPTDANVLILGENGTGKELAAREIHRRSLRQDEVFMAVDLGALSESLFESELFGHKKGAFTGATQDRIGRLEASNGGSLFLDEIGNIPLALQAKLLSVLEQREVRPLGSNTSIPIDVRVIAATNLSADKLHSDQVFRQDLLFRLNTVEIVLPALRERLEDVLSIAEHYAELYAHKYRKANKTFSPTALSALQQYSWPGNVRALRHCIERAIILSEAQEIEPADLQLKFEASEQTSYQGVTPELKPSKIALEEDLNLERMEQRLISSALKQHRYNISHAAKSLGLTRAALYRRMEKYGL